MKSVRKSDARLRSNGCLMGLNALFKERERVETGPKLSALLAVKKQKILDRIEKEMRELQAKLPASAYARANA